MSIPEIDSSQGIEALADAQLQQELYSLFIIDTQEYLQKYSQIAQSLQPQSWRADIQELYRCIHTIKGGAVTVGALAVLDVATALEDVLSDLRYLELAPLLGDGHLSQALLEAGELLTVTVEFQQSKENDPLLNRIQVLHEEIRKRYLSQWNELRQLHQDFAEQGLDLVVLELEIALEQLPAQGTVPARTLHTAQQTLEQLEQIGQELQFAPGWTDLLTQAQTLLNHPDNAIWRLSKEQRHGQSQWSLLFQALKTCAKQSGNPVFFEFASFEASVDDGRVAEPQFYLETTPEDDSAQLEADLLSQSNLLSLEPNPSDAFLDDSSQTDTLDDVGAFLDALNLGENSTIPEITNFLDAFPLEDWANLTEVEPPLAQPNPVDALTDPEEVEAFLNQDDSADLPLDFSQVQEWLDETSLDDFVAHPPTPTQEQDSVVDQVQASLEVGVDWVNWGYESDEGDEWQWEDKGEISSPPSPPAPSSSPAELPPVVIDIATAKAERSNKALEMVQIPVPLEKLDQSAKYLVDTLLSLRSTQGFYQALQHQIAQLVTLAQESAQAIAHLRQIQDDYVLLDELSKSTQTGSQGLVRERYRQGYTIINRLLETSLRLSEMGAETGKTSQQVAEYLRNVDNNVLKLQNTIEDSRLVPFQNLGFRARAIIRDLTTRYSKPAKLVVQGEQTELDVNTARNLEPLLLHLIRNAYDHGLESSAERVAQGKPEQGTLTLSLQRLGNLFQLELRDDGRGIDAKAVQARAEALGLPLSNTQTPAELLAVICQPGFSSRTQVSEISGRGIGMDVIAAQVARLGGRMTLHTVQGSGTTFHLKFPVPRLLVSCVMLRSGDSTFALPVDDIKTINLLCNLNLSPVKDSNPALLGMIEDETGRLAALDLLKYWQPHSSTRPLTDTTICLSIYGEEATQGVWLLADELLEQAEVIINPLPKPMVAPDGLIGVSLQTNGALLPVLDAPTLAKRLLTFSTHVLGTASTASSTSEVEQANHLTPSILIVDDAALMRRRLEATLNTYGYPTHSCVDGLEAWNWLQAHPHPNLVITDIEMPNMDGFTLIDRCRKAGITVPILVISSRLSEEWFDEARRLGATDYLTKGFSSIGLIEKVRVLITAT
ncbi:response regulator [Allocoleopsis franciscana]|uniref:histidine kinase n=1 Tax=Allocoleopsis franciscana PCC 7113 TaxID=1173027 RepID=K9WLQ3_9CYAN|nr:response regulator [Allocoleopsis franciscana]AFZ20736.1 chemotaxis protein histidine kinase-like protein [Allocoleopsis franciscana PCC 7113]